MQYYHIEIRTVPYYHDPIMLAVKSFKELKDFVKHHIEYSLVEYEPTKEFLDQQGVKRIFKRFKTSNMYIDRKDGSVRKTGKVFFIEYEPTEQKMEELKDFGYQSYVSYWCHKYIKKDLCDLGRFEFKEIDEL